MARTEESLFLFNIVARILISATLSSSIGASVCLFLRAYVRFFVTFRQWRFVKDALPLITEKQRRLNPLRCICVQIKKGQKWIKTCSYALKTYEINIYCAWLIYLTAGLLASFHVSNNKATVTTQYAAPLQIKLLLIKPPLY